jgi:DNA-binding Xre family transcriptional regulator
METENKSKKRNLISLTPIRVEKETLKFPIHTLSKKGDSKIDVKGIDQNGNEFRWQVSPNLTYGHPGELAYKLDTIIINRRIEAARKEKSKIIKLGSLRAICRELGLNEGKGTSDVKKALYQNAFAGIVAKLTYRGIDGREITVEKGFSRYTPVFVGQTLLDGRKADAVYIELNDSYMELLQTAHTRPLDYDYLRELPPTAQRFYELISPKIFAAIKHKLPHVKYLYSEFCLYSTLTRNFDRRSFKKQIDKILKPHKESGYIREAAYHETISPDGKPDWWLYLMPGEKAKLEYQQFYLKQPLEIDLDEDLKKTVEVANVVASVHASGLIHDLVTLGIVEQTAERLASERKERAREWVEAVKANCLPKNVRDVAAYVTKAILQDYGLPKSFIKLKKERQAKTHQNLPLFPKIQIKPELENPKIDKKTYEELCKGLGVKPVGIETIG